MSIPEIETKAYFEDAIAQMGVLSNQLKELTCKLPIALQRLLGLLLDPFQELCGEALDLNPISMASKKE